MNNLTLISNSIIKQIMHHINERLINYILETNNLLTY